jgi:hypothetical protein
VQTADLVQNVFARGVYRYSNRGHLIIDHTDRAELVS